MLGGRKRSGWRKRRKNKSRKWEEVEEGGVKEEGVKREGIYIGVKKEEDAEESGEHFERRKRVRGNGSRR